MKKYSFIYGSILILLPLFAQAQVLKISEIPDVITLGFGKDFVDPNQAKWTKSIDSNGAYFKASFEQDDSKKEVFYIDHKFFLSSTQLNFSYYPKKVVALVDSLFSDYKISNIWMERNTKQQYAYKVEMYIGKGKKKMVKYAYFASRGYFIEEWEQGEKIPNFVVQRFTPKFKGSVKAVSAN